MLWAEKRKELLRLGRGGRRHESRKARRLCLLGQKAECTSHRKRKTELLVKINGKKSQRKRNLITLYKKEGLAEKKLQRRRIDPGGAFHSKNIVSDLKTRC